MSSLPVQQPQSVPALGEVLITLRLYWEKQQHWAKEEQRLGYDGVCGVLSALNRMCVRCVATQDAFLPPRLEELTRPLCTILHQANLLPVAVSQNLKRVEHLSRVATCASLHCVGSSLASGCCRPVSVCAMQC